MVGFWFLQCNIWLERLDGWIDGCLQNDCEWWRRNRKNFVIVLCPSTRSHSFYFSCFFFMLTLCVLCLAFSLLLLLRVFFLFFYFALSCWVSLFEWNATRLLTAVCELISKRNKNVVTNKLFESVCLTACRRIFSFVVVFLLPSESHFIFSCNARNKRMDGCLLWLVR